MPRAGHGHRDQLLRRRIVGQRHDEHLTGAHRREAAEAQLAHLGVHHTEPSPLALLIHRAVRPQQRVALVRGHDGERVAQEGSAGQRGEVDAEARVEGDAVDQARERLVEQVDVVAVGDGEEVAAHGVVGQAGQAAVRQIDPLPGRGIQLRQVRQRSVVGFGIDGGDIRRRDGPRSAQRDAPGQLLQRPDPVPRVQGEAHGIPLADERRRSGRHEGLHGVGGDHDHEQTDGETEGAARLPRPAFLVALAEEEEQHADREQHNPVNQPRPGVRVDPEDGGGEALADIAGQV